VDSNPEDRREETRRPSDRSPSEGSPSEAANEGREGNRRGQQVPPALETSEAGSVREEPFPHKEERPQDGLERPWWQRIFRGPHEEATQRRWWEFWR
jgi:hypothetical protein